MAKLKGKGVVVAGLLAGAASFLSKKENRDKAMEFLNMAKEKANGNSGIQSFLQKAEEKANVNGEASSFPKDLDTNISKSASVGKEEYAEETFEDIAKTAADIADTTLEGNQMIEEGAQTTTNYYNHEQEKRS